MVRNDTTTSAAAPANPWVISVRDLVQSPGQMRTEEDTWPAPDSLSVPLIGIPAGADTDVDLRIESVHEGILVTGTVAAEAVGECSRCLDPIHENVDVNVQELFLFEPEGDDEEQRLVEHETVDLEPVVRDAVVTAMPFQPVCREDCPGLCAQCGIRLEDAPADHHHEQLDPRWAALAPLASSAESEDTGLDNMTSNNETEER